MPRNAAGVYSLPSGNPVVTDTIIETNWANPTLADIGNELTNSLDRAGRGGMTGPFSIADGTAAAPGLRFTNDPANGLYHVGVNQWALVANGAVVANIAPAMFQVPAGVNFVALGGFKAPDGTTLLPSYSFQNEVASGWYRKASGTFWFAVGGVDIFAVTSAGVELAPGLTAVNLAGGLQVQDLIPVPLNQGQEWFKSNDGQVLMRYVNPDTTQTLVATSGAGGDFVPYGEKGVALGVATLDAGGQVPASQLGNTLHRNYIINGGCRVAQRGTYSSPLPVAGVPTYGGCDRIAGIHTNASVFALQQFVGNPNSVSRFGQSMGLTTPASGNAYLLSRIEAKDTKPLNGKTITLTALVTTNGAGAWTCIPGIYKANAEDNFGTMTLIGLGAAVPIPASATPTRVSMTIALGTADASNGLQVQFDAAFTGAQAGVFWSVSDFQLTESPAAVPFQDRPIAEELALCQRYYFRDASLSGVPRTRIQYSYVAGNTHAFQTFPVPMRTDPNVVLENPVYAFGGSAGSVAGQTFFGYDSSFAAGGINATMSWTINANAEL